MKAFLLLLLIACFDNGYNIFTFVGGSANITLLRKESTHYHYDAWCVGQGAAALSWISPTNPEVSVTDFTHGELNETYCSLIKRGCKGWTGWDVVSSLHYPMPYLTDYQWNDLPYMRTTGKHEFFESNNIRLDVEKLDLAVSILAESDAYIYLSEGLDPRVSNCYYIIFAGWIQKNGDGSCAVRRCPEGVKAEIPKNCEVINNKFYHFKAADKVLSLERWSHFRIKVNRLRIGLNFVIYYNKQVILNVTDTSTFPFQPNFLNCKSFINAAYFRFQNYKYFLGVENQKMYSDWFQERPIECISILYSFNGTSHNNYLEIMTENDQSRTRSIKKLQQTEGEWKRERFLYESDDQTRYKKLVLEGKGESSFAVGGIQRCNPDIDFQISKISEITSSWTDLSCKVVYNPEENVELKSVDPNFGGWPDKSTLSCAEFGLDKDLGNCEGVGICRKVQDSATNCMCSSGYKKQKCDYECTWDTDRLTYGNNCKQKCGYCASGNSCNSQTGVCQNGCKGGYREPLCNLTYPRFTKAPVHYSSTPVSVAVYVDHFEYKGLGEPNAYTIQYKDNSKEWFSVKNYTFPSNDICNVTGLSHGKDYSFRAIIIDKSGHRYMGSRIPFGNYSTTCNNPEVFITPSSRAIKLSFKVGMYACDHNIYRFVLLNSMETVQSFTLTAFSEFNISRLTPFTNYTWHLLHNGSSILEGKVSTLEDVPSQVTALTLTALNQSNLLISWKEPADPNGRIKYYTVKYKHCGYLNCPEMHCVNEKLKNETSLSAVLSNLEPYSKYSVSVEAYTVGYGKEVSVEGNTLGYGILKLQPEYDNIFKKATSVTVKWKRPADCSKIQGYVTGYEAVLKALNEWDNRISIKPNYLLTFSATFLNLIPYTQYEVDIRIKGEEGISEVEYALIKNFTTLPTEPGIVRNAVCYSQGENWIYVKWLAPSPPNGELEKYLLSYRKGYGKWNVVSDIGSCHLYEGWICGRIESSPALLKDTDYQVRIAAKNRQVDQIGEYFTFYVATKQKAPDAPLNVTAIALSSHQVKLAWNHPYITRGRLTRFNVRGELTSTGMKDKTSLNINESKVISKEEKSYYLELANLRPASSYRLEIFGITISAGNQTTFSFKTPMPVPNIGSVLNYNAESLTNTSFQIMIPAAVDVSLTEKSAYILIVVSKSELLESDNESGLKLTKEVKEEVKMKIIKEAELEDRKCWIAAEIKPDQEVTFTVGDNNTFRDGVTAYTSYSRNHPLVPGGYYQVLLLALNEWEGEYQYSIIKLQDFVHTLHEHTPPDGGNTAVWVILVLLLICIPIVGYFIYRKRKQIKRESDMLELKRAEVLSGSMDNVVTPDPDSEEMQQETGPKLPPSQRFTRRVAIDDLEQYVKIGITSGELQRQHALFPRGQTRPWDYGKQPANKPKNRYGNLVAYDDTRVKLKKLPEDPNSDYINANYINGYKSAKFYIATQGPKHNTIVDFWRMVWQEQVQVIAMLTNVIENGKAKCEQYWPELGHEVTYGAVTILNASNQIFADYTFRILNVTSKGKTRKVHHLHFTSWPDHGVPLYPQSVATYLKKLLATPPGSGPILVHCSAGVGRTGTIVLADICLRMAAAEGCVDVLGYQQQIREQRANMVDNLDQYKLVHLVLLECLVTEPSSYPCDGNFEKRIQELSTSGTMQRQFNYLHEQRWQNQALKPVSRQTVLSPAQMDPSKNRNLNIVPGLNGRVFISPCPPTHQNTDYINAVYVDGFRVKEQFIVTQFPLESTIGDFWRLIAEKNISLVVVLNEIHKDEGLCDFWPVDEGQSMKPVPHLTVVKKSEDNSERWNIHSIRVVDNGRLGDSQSKPLQVLHLKGWRSDENLPPSTDLILELWQETERLCGGKTPIVVTCVDGATSSGYFVALAFLIEKIKLEQHCDVCQAVRTVRQNREQFVLTLEQFEYLYKAAVTYLDSFQLYANFN